MMLGPSRTLLNKLRHAPHQHLHECHGQLNQGPESTAHSKRPAGLKKQVQLDADAQVQAAWPAKGQKKPQQRTAEYHMEAAHDWAHKLDGLAETPRQEQLAPHSPRPAPNQLAAAPPHFGRTSLEAQAVPRQVMPIPALR